MNSMKKIEDAVRTTLDPIRRGVEIRRLEKSFRFFRVALPILAAGTILITIVPLLRERAYFPLVMILAFLALAYAGHMAEKMRLVQLKVEEERCKKEQNEREQGTEGEG